MRKSPAGSYRSGGGKLICDHCGYNKICSQAPISECDKFLPALPFNDISGTQKIFNTVRIGKAWSERLSIGQNIALYDVNSLKIFGFASVLNIFTGQIEEILKRHAHANHLMLAEMPEEAESILYQWMRQQYGPRIVHDQAKLTAIYLLREHISPSPPYFGGHEANGSSESSAADQG